MGVRIVTQPTDMLTLDWAQTQCELTQERMQNSACGREMSYLSFLRFEFACLSLLLHGQICVGKNPDLPVSGRFAELALGLRVPRIVRVVGV